MRKILRILFLLFITSGYVLGQGSGKTIVEDINTSSTSKGRISIMQDEAVEKIVGIFSPEIEIIESEEQPSRVHDNTPTPEQIASGDYVRVRGWKIQVYSGNDPKKSKGEAEYRRGTVKNSFPSLEANITYNAPVWHLRVGNFIYREDAEDKLHELKHALPSLAREMYVVPDVVKKY